MQRPLIGGLLASLAANVVLATALMHAPAVTQATNAAITMPTRASTETSSTPGAAATPSGTSALTAASSSDCAQQLDHARELLRSQSAELTKYRAKDLDALWAGGERSPTREKVVAALLAGVRARDIECHDIVCDYSLDAATSDEENADIRQLSETPWWRAFTVMDRMSVNKPNRVLLNADASFDGATACRMWAGVLASEKLSACGTPTPGSGIDVGVDASGAFTIYGVKGTSAEQAACIEAVARANPLPSPPAGAPVRAARVTALVAAP